MTSPLGLLEIAGLIRRTGVGTESEYIFRHTLLRETAYASLLLEERVALHCNVGEAIERVYSKSNGEYASVLAHHFLRGDQKDKAFRYLCEAGDEAARVYALAEALEHYGKALELAKEGQGGVDDIQHLYERRGRMLELGGDYDNAIEVYQDMEQFGRQREWHELEVRGLVRRANVLCLPNEAMDLEQGEKLSKRALQMAEDQGDGEAQCLALWNLMMRHEFEEDYLAAIEYGERALELAESLNLTSQRAFILNDLGGISLNVGRFEQGHKNNLQAQELWKELDNLPMLVDSLCNEMGIHFFQGRYDKALQISERASQLSEKIDNPWGQSFSRYLVYWVPFERGDIQTAVEMASACVRYAEQARFVVPLAQTKAELGLLHAFMGDFKTALEMTAVAADNADRYIPAWKMSVLALEMLCRTWAGDLIGAHELMSELERQPAKHTGTTMTFLHFVMSLAMPELALAEERWQDALEEAEANASQFLEQSIKFARPDFVMFAGLALLGMDRLEEAQAKLEDARSLMEENGSRRSLWRVLGALARIAENLGEQNRADDLRAEATDVIEHIAAHCPSPQLRASFLEREEVRSAIQNMANST